MTVFQSQPGSTNAYKAKVKAVMEDVDALDLPDGAHWALIHEQLGLEYGDVFDIIAADPSFFDYE
jgi:hypothetical protein